MTVSEMHVAVKLGLDKSSALELPSFEPEEIDYWLNVGQDDYVHGKYNEYKVNVGNNKSTKEIQEELSSLLKYTAFTPSATTGFFEGKGYYIDLESLATYTVRYVLSAIATVNRQLEDGSSVTTALVFCNDVEINNLDKYIITAYNQRPYFENPVYFISQAYSADPNRGLTIITDYYTSALSKVDLIYVREPKKLNRSTDNDTLTTTCELPKYTHQKIVDLTVFLMLENIESKRFQTNNAILNKDSNG